MIYDYLDKYTYEFLLQEAMDSITDPTIDKRQGSIIFDAIAPACYVLAQYFVELKNVASESYIMYATGENLDYRAAEQGIVRRPASAAVRKGLFYNSTDALINIPLGSRFSAIGTDEPITYTVTKVVSIGNCELTCEQIGEIGNVYSGDLIAISNIAGYARAELTDIIIPGEDMEDDDSLRLRYVDEVNNSAFGGNIYDYDKFCKTVEGVGDVQVYPVWNGGGTVKISVVGGATFLPASAGLVSQLQMLLDPATQGQGLGQAPIGHVVTVVAPTVFPVNVSATLSLAGGVTIGQVTPLINDSIEEYMLSVRKTWGAPAPNGSYAANVYTAQVTSAILRVPGVNNVTNVLTNGNAGDEILTETAALQQLPTLGTLTLS